MFKQSTKDTINGWGVVFRFVTPVLVSIALWVVSDMKSELKEARETMKDFAVQITTYNTNHLAHHSEFEKELCERMSSVEALLRRK